MDEVKYYPARMDYPNLCKPYSNADRIRSMSDEELAVAIAELACTVACNDFGITVNVKCCRNCTRCTGIIDWLKQPAEVRE